MKDEAKRQAMRLYTIIYIHICIGIYLSIDTRAQRVRDSSRWRDAVSAGQGSYLELALSGSFVLYWERWGTRV